MTTDKELLELAAKACGWTIRPSTFYHDGYVVTDADGEKPWMNWNPLTNDGDALRLAVKMGVQVDCDNGNSMSCVWRIDEDGNPIEETIMCERWSDDPCAATRRAIVRAAAELGKAKP